MDSDGTLNLFKCHLIYCFIHFNKFVLAQAALLWALLCSIALRDFCDSLVRGATALLDESSSVPHAVARLAMLAFAGVTDAFQVRQSAATMLSKCLS